MDGAAAEGAAHGNPYATLASVAYCRMKTPGAATSWSDRADRAVMERKATPLGREFYERPAEPVARDLIGKILSHGPVAGRIVEVEAYLGEHDLAAHAAAGRTPRTGVLYGPPGHAYVYLIYGMYHCLNVVTEPDGTPGCVLIRALEPLIGIAEMKARRPAARRLEDLASGPGRLTRALAIGPEHNGSSLLDGPLTIRARAGADELPLVVTPRIGISRAADWPLRFALAGSPFVSRPAWTRRHLEPEAARLLSVPAG
jgi:DNA-3-methyladenine glycosylase